MRCAQKGCWIEPAHIGDPFCPACGHPLLLVLTTDEQEALDAQEIQDCDDATQQCEVT
jgi:hypothetical protein